MSSFEMGDLPETTIQCSEELQTKLYVKWGMLENWDKKVINRLMATVNKQGGYAAMLIFDPEEYVKSLGGAY